MKAGFYWHMTQHHQIKEFINKEVELNWTFSNFGSQTETAWITKHVPFTALFIIVLSFSVLRDGLSHKI